MKRYPPITKKEFRELCELSDGPVAVGSAVKARVEAEAFDRMNKRNQSVPVRLKIPSSPGVIELREKYKAAAEFLAKSKVYSWTEAVKLLKQAAVKKNSHKKMRPAGSIRAAKAALA